MSLGLFKTIMKHLRFDDASDRSSRRISDKFCLVSEIWKDFIQNCQKCYVPDFDLTIDEQLFPCKTRCPLIQYMPNKRDKFDIKFWLLTDAKSKYLCNGKPYLGKDPARKKGTDLPADVCLSLLKPYFNKGYNVTTDNYFSSLSLANSLLSKKLQFLGQFESKGVKYQSWMLFWVKSHCTHHW